MEEKSIEELLETIPYKIVKQIKDRCFSCGQEHKILATYNLQIEVFQYEIRQNVVIKKFKIYYRTTSFCDGDNRKYIGNPCGTGFLTFKEAFNELEMILNNE